jgi:hypothetical protein
MVGGQVVNLGCTIHPARDDPPYRNGLTPPRLFCGMYTYHKRQYLLKAATESWAFHCDGFVAFSDETIPTLGAVDLPYYGGEFYGNMWQKVRSIWCYIYTNYYDQYDYFHVAGDDTLMIVENLRITCGVLMMITARSHCIWVGRT